MHIVKNEREISFKKMKIDFTFEKTIGSSPKTLDNALYIIVQIFTATFRICS